MTARTAARRRTEPTTPKRGAVERVRAQQGALQGGTAASTTWDESAIASPVAGGRWLSAISAAVEGLGYDLVDIERLPRGLMRVSIDRIPGRAYPIESEFVTVDDCEQVTRQLQLVLEVEAVPYERLEVSSPGLDRPLRKPSDWQRFVGVEVDVTFRQAFQGRRKFRGLLIQVEPTPRLAVRLGAEEQALDFTLDEVREARLVPVVDFKGRGKGARNGEQGS